MASQAWKGKMGKAFTAGADDQGGIGSLQAA